jgi:hypothetical protein
MMRVDIMKDIHYADHAFYVTVTGDDVRIDVVKSRNGLAHSNNDPRLESLRAAVLRYVDGEVA